MNRNKGFIMIKINEVIIVEGKYDAIKISSIVDTTIVTTDGFRIFSDEYKCSMIKQLAETNGIIILTDSDVAGFKIRNFLCGLIDSSKIKHVYVPNIFGKEKRKTSYSKERFLGVEGINIEVLLKSFEDAGITHTNQYYGTERKKLSITRLDLFEDGLIGSDNSYKKRQLLLSELGLPRYLSTNALINVLNSMLSLDGYKNIIQKLY